MAFSASHITNLNNSMVAAQAVALGTIVSALTDRDEVVAGTHTVTAAQASASLAVIPTGATVTSWVVNIMRSGSTVTADAYITAGSGTNIRVADGGSTYNLAENDVINYIVW